MSHSPSIEIERIAATQQSFTPQKLSNYSTRTVPDSSWFSADIQLGAGVVIIQPSTGKIVLLSDMFKEKDANGKEYEYEAYFLPKGRKDIGESLETAALREGYEEVSGSHKS